MIKKIRTLVTAVLISFTIAAPTFAAPANTNGISNAVSGGQTTTGASKCGDTQTQLIACDPSDKTGLGTINGLIKIAVTVLTVAIGTVAVGGLAYAAILYASARDNQSQITESRTIIRNILIGLALYGFTIVIVNWLIPGGVIGGGTDATASPSVSPSVSTSPVVTPTQ